MSVAVSVRLSEEQVAELDRLAKVEERDRSWLIKRAVEAMLADERAWLEHAREAIRQADAGEFATDEEVEAMWRSFEA